MPADEPERRYEIGEVLGEGGMARVHRAFDTLLRRTVALKLLILDDAATTERFLRGARAQARVVHDHICPVYEVGELGGRPFIAMQLVAGETLGAAAAHMSVEQKARVLREVAAAVHAAHEAGLVHRDLKPSNILVERGEAGEWRPCVLDFGIAREVGGAELTLTGQVLGSPCYMAPEQALGRVAEVDRRTDVYALGATLYELLSGMPPFTGASVGDILLQVADRDPVPLRRRNPRIPVDLETIAMLCLSKDPGERYGSARALADDLARYLDGRPVEARRPGALARLRGRIRRNKALALTIGATLIAIAGVAVALPVAAAVERDRRVLALRSDGDGALAEAGRLRREEEATRRRALALFVEGDRGEAEALWSRVRALGPSVERAYARAGRAFEAALAQDRKRDDVRAILADALLDSALWAERHGTAVDRQEIAERLAIYDADGSRRARLLAPARLDLETRPHGATVTLAAYVPDGFGKLREEPRGELGTTPLRDAPLPAGSYVLLLGAPGRVPVRSPLVLSSGETLRLIVDLPRPDAVPEGFLYVPPGRFLTGNAEEAIRTTLSGTPLREAETAAYLIGRHEVTMTEWIAFLESLPPDERRRRAPRAWPEAGIAVELREVAGQGWKFIYRPEDGYTYEALPGEKLRYPRRDRRAEQDFMRFPVVGISPEDAAAYLAWLDASRRVPGARFCSRDEWERAARGADGREYPTGGSLDPDEANFDVTYDRLDWGPDEVGSHPGSRSPFGLDDVAGNAFEWTRAPDGTFGGCSGAYFLNEWSNALTSCDTVPPTMRVPVSGLRVCASFAPGEGP